MVIVSWTQCIFLADRVETAPVERWHLAGACFGDFLGILAQDSGCDDASVVRMVQQS